MNPQSCEVSCPRSARGWARERVQCERVTYGTDVYCDYNARSHGEHGRYLAKGLLNRLGRPFLSLTGKLSTNHDKQVSAT